MHILENNSTSPDPQVLDNLNDSLIIAAKRGYDAWFKEVNRYAHDVLITLNNQHHFLNRMIISTHRFEHTRFFLEYFSSNTSDKPTQVEVEKFRVIFES